MTLKKRNQAARRGVPIALAKPPSEEQLTTLLEACRSGDVALQACRLLDLAISAVKYDGNGTPQVDRSVWELVKAKATPVLTHKLPGTRFALKDNLRPSELLILQRALVHYCKAYDRVLCVTQDDFVRNECREAIQAADALSNRLRYDLVNVTGKKEQ